MKNKELNTLLAIENKYPETVRNISFYERNLRHIRGRIGFLRGRVGAERTIQELEEQMDIMKAQRMAYREELKDV